MRKPSWYKPIENFLNPLQWLVNIGLIAIATISILLIFNKNSVVKTGWLVYMVSP